MPLKQAIEEAVREGTHSALLPDHPEVIRMAIEDRICRAYESEFGTK
jgi:hypothetical protein